MDQPTLDDERRHLDELLNKRFHFFVLLVSALGAGLFTQDSIGTPRTQALLALGFAASLTLCLIILRTAALLKVVLEMIVGKRGLDGECVSDVPDAPAASGAAIGPAEHPHRIAFRVLQNRRLLRVNAIDVIRWAVVAATAAIFLVLVWSLAVAPDPTG